MDRRMLRWSLVVGLAKISNLGILLEPTIVHRVQVTLILVKPSLHCRSQPLAVPVYVVGVDRKLYGPSEVD